MENGSWVVTGGHDATVTQAVAAGGPSSAQPTHRAKILSLAVSVDGKQWATGHIDGKVCLGLGPIMLPSFLGSPGWVPALEEQPSSVHCLMFSPDNRWLLACTEDGFVRIWDVRDSAPTLSKARFVDACNETRPICQSIEVGPSALYALDIAPDGQTIAVAGLEGTIRLVDPMSREILQTLQGHRDAVYALHFSADGQMLASGSGDGSVRLWSPKTGKQVGCLSGHHGAVYSVEFDLSGRRLLSADTAGLVVVWDTTTWSKLYEQRLPGKVLCAALAPDGRRIAAGNACGKCYLIDLP